MGNPLEAFGELFTDKQVLSKFLSNYSSIDPAKQKIDNFDFTFSLDFDQNGNQGQKTTITSSVTLSSEVKKAEDSGNNFVPNYAQDVAT